MKKIIIFLVIFFLSLTLYTQNNHPLVQVNSLQSLKKELLNKNNKVIYLPSNLKLDFSNEKTIEIPEGTILKSDRGTNGSLGALLYSNNFGTNPMFVCKGDNITIEGVRIKGPDSMLKQDSILLNRIIKAKKNNKSKSDIHMIYVSGLPNSVGIKFYGKNNIIKNCELFGWSRAALHIGYSANVIVKESFIHHNQRVGLGYGILVQGISEIYNNIFDYNRHAIASSGKWRASYHAHHNICLSNSGVQSHVFDVHGGKDRKDGTDIAGRFFLIHDNIFFMSNNLFPAFMIRGKSTKITKVYNNTIFVKSINKFDYIVQLNTKGNFIMYNNKKNKF